MFDYDALMQMAAAAKDRYASAAPFPHAHFDDFLPSHMAEAVSAALPHPDDGGKFDFFYAKGFEEKWAVSDDAALPPPARELVREFNSSHYIRFLEALTGIPHLLPDPHLFGGGAHLVKRGGVLQIHSDFNWAEHLKAHRRVNMFVYLTPDWRAEWGGALELWDRACKEKVCEYAPRFNRLVVFSSSSDTFHGHPHPLECPEGVLRRSIAMYYYTSERPAEEMREPHNTLYKGYHF
ncbi:MAG: 2OG-Fe(II) oxygenase [Betaproteobacteria bacterium]|nr:2OG-Fe(II) oxygenase [Betaproteobacteria bacterium]